MWDSNALIVSEDHGSNSQDYLEVSNSSVNKSLNSHILP
jgi:hypothetical protein